MRFSEIKLVGGTQGKQRVRIGVSLPKSSWFSRTVSWQISSEPHGANAIQPFAAEIEQQTIGRTAYRKRRQRALVTNRISLSRLASARNFLASTGAGQNRRNPMEFKIGIKPLCNRYRLTGDPLQPPI